MKTFFSFLVIAVLANSSFASQDSEEIKGNYFQNIDGNFELVANVYQSAGQVKIEFFNACIAVLKRGDHYWEGSCSKGSGYNLALYQAQINKNGSQYILLFKVNEHGDSDLSSVSGFSTAYKQ